MFTFYINDVQLFECPIPGPKGVKRKRRERKLMVYIGKIVVKLGLGVLKISTFYSHCAHIYTHTHTQTALNSPRTINWLVLSTDKSSVS